MTVTLSNSPLAPGEKAAFALVIFKGKVHPESGAIASKSLGFAADSHRFGTIAAILGKAGSFCCQLVS